MNRHVMTSARKRALRKAQLASAKKRAGRGARKVGRAVHSQRHAAALILAGVAVGSGVYAAHHVSNKRAIVRKRAEMTLAIESRRKKNALAGPSRGPGRYAYVEIKVSPETKKSNVVDPRKARGKIKVFTNVTHPAALAIMQELQGKPTVRNKDRRYVVVRGGTTSMNLPAGLEPKN
jgi:hypothetical protein